MKLKDIIAFSTVFALLLAVVFYEYNVSVKQIPSKDGEISDRTFYQGISAKKLSEIIEKGVDFTLLDVRSTSKYKDAHIPGAISLEYPRIDGTLNSFPKNNLIVLYCESGPWSRLAYDKFIENNFTNVKLLVNGFVGWKWEIDGEVVQNK